MLQVIGAGLPRTGTYSLRAALITLLGGDCYHMRTVRENADHVPIWLDALNGNQRDWPALFSGCTAAVDWPVSAFWREIAAAFPDALILLSVRKDAATWWRSFNENIVSMISQDRALGNEPWHTMAVGLCDRELGKTWDDQASAKAAYNRHIETVRTTVPPHQLVQWQPDDGWQPLCQALELPIPAEPFPYLNTTANRRQLRNG